MHLQDSMPASLGLPLRQKPATPDLEVGERMEAMANELGMSTGSLSTYGQHPSFEPSARPLHVIVAGAGPSGIAIAIELKKLTNVTFQIFEKNDDVGGTWKENRYPGAACDVAAHAYQYTFASNTEWSSHFAPAKEINDYFISVAKEYDLYPFITFNSKVDGAEWDERTGKWTITVRSVDEPTTESLLVADVFVNAGGILNDWQWPDIAGLNNFKGVKLHTAAWDQAFDPTDKSIAVIGSGATGIQVVPSIQPKARHLDVYVRSPTYIIPRVGFGVESAAFNEPYTDEEKQKFSDDPKFYKQFRKKIEQQMNENFLGSVKNSQAQAEGRKWAENLMRDTIKSEKLQKELIPSWELGCRRLTPGLPYLKAVQEPNVNIIRAPIDRITDDGIQTTDGVVHEVDAIVCATGFTTSFCARYDIIGRNHENLRQLWDGQPPQAYFGLSVSNYPNFFMSLGPNCPIANGSLIPCIESSAKYIAQVLVKMQKDQIKALSVKPTVQTALNQYMQKVHEDLVWTGACQSWYKHRATGQVTAVWPGSSIHYMEAIETPRWEDYDIEYMNANPFMFLGNGTSQREKLGADLTYYLDQMAE